MEPSAPAALRSPELSESVFKRALNTHLFSTARRHWEDFMVLAPGINIQTYLHRETDALLVLAFTIVGGNNWVSKLVCPNSVPELNPLIGTLKPQSNGHYTAIRWLVHWPLIGELLHLVQRGRASAGCGPAESPPHCTKCNSPPINGQCTNFILFDVAL